MANTLKKGAAQLKELAGTAQPVIQETAATTTKTEKTKKVREAVDSKSTVLIGAHFPRIVRRSLAQLQADPRGQDPLLRGALLSRADQRLLPWCVGRPRAAARRGGPSRRGAHRLEGRAGRRRCAATLLRRDPACAGAHRGGDQSRRHKRRRAGNAHPARPHRGYFRQGI